jgi:hypothetical protein
MIAGRLSFPLILMGFVCAGLVVWDYMPCGLVPVPVGCASVGPGLEVVLSIHPRLPLILMDKECVEPRLARSWAPMGVHFARWPV